MVCGRVLPSYLIIGEQEWWVLRPHPPIDNNGFEEGRNGLRPRTPSFSLTIDRWLLTI